MKEFKIISNSTNDYDSLAIESNRIQECLEEMKRRNLKNMAINSAFGWEIGTQIDFIKDNLWIEGIQIGEDNIDISIINNLTNLKRLGIGTAKIKGRLDFCNFPNLEILSVMWIEKQYSNLYCATNLKFISINKFPYDNFEKMSGFSKLEWLQLNYGKLKSVDGVQYIKKLKYFDLYSMPSLESLTGMKGITESLETFSIEKCKNADLSVLREMLNLKVLHILDCSPLASVDFVKKMSNLKHAYFGIEILDRDVSVLKERGFDFKKSKNY